MTRSMSSQPTCPSCECKRVRLFYEARSVPVNSVLLLASRKEALAFPTGDIRLGFCEECGFIYNTAFDPTLVEYSARCEESQGFSPFFREWHETLARRLIDRYSLRHKNVVEIGCGKGDFLSLLCQLGDNRGVGFDPAYVPGRAAEAPSRIKVIQDFYTEKDRGIHADFLCCKMTLEHIADTAAFVRMVRDSLADSRDSHVFFQVPNVMRVLEEGAFWDIYYEHCSYFGAHSLSQLFCLAGFDVLEVEHQYGDQYVTIEARIGNGSREAVRDLENVREAVTRFNSRVSEGIGKWKRRLEAFREKRLKTVIWGAGSKGVAFVAAVDVPGAIGYAVDINPHMRAHYLAKSGLEIVEPSVLCDYRPDIVIVMNPVYRAEIIAELDKFGLRPEVVSV